MCLNKKYPEQKGRLESDYFDLEPGTSVRLEVVAVHRRAYTRGVEAYRSYILKLSMTAICLWVLVLCLVQVNGTLLGFFNCKMKRRVPTS